MLILKWKLFFFFLFRLFLFLYVFPLLDFLLHFQYPAASHHPFTLSRSVNHTDVINIIICSWCYSIENRCNLYFPHFLHLLLLVHFEWKQKHCPIFFSFSFINSLPNINIYYVKWCCICYFKCGQAKLSQATVHSILISSWSGLCIICNRVFSMRTYKYIIIIFIMFIVSITLLTSWILINYVFAIKCVFSFPSHFQPWIKCLNIA